MYCSADLTKVNLKNQIGKMIKDLHRIKPNEEELIIIIIGVKNYFNHRQM